MPFPRKFEKLLETELNDVESPDYVWLTYAVCAVEKDSCGWGGWMIEGAFKRREGKIYPTGTGDALLSAIDEQICPRCGKDLFRTGASVRYEPSKDQKRPLVKGVDYEVVPMEYDDSE